MQQALQEYSEQAKPYADIRSLLDASSPPGPCRCGPVPASRPLWVLRRAGVSMRSCCGYKRVMTQFATMNPSGFDWDGPTGNFAAGRLCGAAHRTADHEVLRFLQSGL